MSENWAAEQAQRVGSEVRRLRGGRSAQWVSDRTEELGYRVARAKIAELETGRREFVTTAELCILAAALDTAPVMLLYPPPYGEGARVEVIPGLDELTTWGIDWFAGYARNPPIKDINVDPLVSIGNYLANIDPLKELRSRGGEAALGHARDLVAQLKAVVDSLGSNREPR